MITKRQLGLAMPAALSAGRIDTWYDPLANAMRRYDISTDTRVAMFLANVAEETGQLQAKEENLHYSGDRLIAVFPSLFASNQDLAYQLAGQGPEAIANYIYDDANRPPGYKMGNTHPGDGWKYRGRGPDQETGRDNYVKYFRSKGLPDDTDPDVLLDPAHGAEASAQQWHDAGCNALADAGNFAGVVRAINGGMNGYAQRQMYLDRFVAALKNPDPVVQPPAPKVTVVVPPAPPEVAQPMPSIEPAPIGQPLPDLTPTAPPLPPKLEPIPPMPPVPPPGYSVQPTGNVVRDDVNTSPIMKGAKVGQVVTGVAGTAVTAATGAQAVKSIFGGFTPSDVGIIVMGVVAIVAMISALIYFGLIRRERTNMNKAGIA